MLQASAISQIQEYTVSQISDVLKSTLEEKFCSVKIRGEISGLKVAASGHAYFNLKDNNAVLNAVCWGRIFANFPFKPEEGMEVTCTGKISAYVGRSNYQLIIDKMESAGIGALLAMLEKRRNSLEKEGLFALERKQKLPFLPKVIGIITSPTGAVIKDMLHRINERFPTHVILWPVLVQGNGAAEQIAQAINGFNNLTSNLPKPEVLIVARGGGSIEDLWAFNEEVVVRAAANSKIPLLSAVGHETDVTLIDYASDRRAPTPTAAAEMAVPVRTELQSMIKGYNSRLDIGVSRYIKELEAKLHKSNTGLISFSQDLQNLLNNLSKLGIRISFALRKLLENRERKLEILIVKLSSKPFLYKCEQKSIKIRDIGANMYARLRNIMTNAQNTLYSLSRLLDSFNYTKVLERG